MAATQGTIPKLSGIWVGAMSGKSVDEPRRDTSELDKGRL